MSESLLLLYSLLLPFALGGLLLELLDRRGALRPAERLALAFPLGSVPWTLLLFAASLAGLPLGKAAALLRWLGIPLLLWAGWRLRFRRLPLPSRNGVAILLLGLLLAGSAAVLPVRYNDAVAIWTLKATVFSLEDTVLETPIFQDPNYRFSHPEYPLHVPLANLWVMGGSGAPRLGNVPWLYALWILSWLGILAGALRRWLGPGPAPLLLLAGFFWQPPMVYLLFRHEADLPLALYFTAALFLVVLALEEEKISLLWLAGVAAAGAVWTKMEGLPWCLVVLAPALLREPSLRRQAWTGFVFPLAVGGLWWVLLFWQGIPSLYRDPLSASRLPEQLGERLAAVGAALFQELHVGQWGAFLLPVFSALLLRSREPRRRLLKATLSLHLLLYLAVYLTISGDLFWYLKTTLSRLLLHTAPGGLLLLAAFLASPGRSVRS